MLTSKKEPTLNLLALRPTGCQYMSEDYDPIEVFDELFNSFHLVDMRSMLYEMFKLASTHPDLEELCGHEEEGRFFFTFELLHDVLTAAYALLKKQIEANVLLTNPSTDH